MADDDVEFSSGGESSDSVTESSEQGLLSRLWDSVGTALLGIVFFLASFVVLYMNEGTVNEADLAKKAAAVDAAKPDQGAIGKFVAATGPLATSARLGDAYLPAGNYVVLTREAEMYAWQEAKDTKTEKSAGGSEKKTTTYKYDTDWTSSPESSDGFKKKEGHHNPPMAVKGETQKAAEAAVGALALQMSEVSLPGGAPVRLEGATTTGGTVSGEHLYVGSARAAEPKVGDVRLSYTALAPGGTYTAFGKLESGTRLAAAEVDKRTMYRVFAGSKEDALKTLQTEYQIWIWGFRLLGFLLCWGGLRMMVSPLNTLLDVLPFLGDMGRGLTGFITFPIALVLSGITIVIAWITHSLVAMVTIGIVCLVLGIKFFGARKDAGQVASRAA
ncbi:MAG: TMEM43 family protein [Candidatus Sericytochromatia bacterium]|nr:TMEM43 family protein [Candidatus Sericytochromatia bacterium]